MSSEVSAQFGDQKAKRVILRQVAAMQRAGWREYSGGGLFTRALLVSADGKWIAKFVEADALSKDGWLKFAPFCHDVYHGKRHISAGAAAKALLPVMPYFKRGKYSAVAIMERLSRLPDADCLTTESERRVRARFGVLENVWNGDKQLRQVWGPLRYLLDTLRDEFGRLPNDMHDGNVMLRRGPRGGRPRLVVTDPYGFLNA